MLTRATDLFHFLEPQIYLIFLSHKFPRMYTNAMRNEFSPNGFVKIGVH